MSVAWRQGALAAHIMKSMVSLRVHPGLYDQCRLPSATWASFPRSPSQPSLAPSPRRSYSSRPHVKPEDLPPKTTITTIRKLYRTNEPISMMTAADYPTGVVCMKADIDICLVGDSLAMVELGYDSTNPLTVEEMLHHCRAVSRGNKSSFLVGDLPFGSYEASPEDALRNAIRIIKEGRMDAVKLEGGSEMIETVRKISQVGIPIMGHLGLTPQRQSSLGGFRVQAKTAEKAKQLLEDALALQEAGCFALVLEAMPEPVAAYVTSRLSIPTIGIGAGVGCSGQVLVVNDMLGLFDRFLPRFCKLYANLNKVMTEALQTYKQEVKTRTFPSVEHTYPMKAEEFTKFLKLVGEPTGDYTGNTGNVERSDYTKTRYLGQQYLHISAQSQIQKQDED